MTSPVRRHSNGWGLKQACRSLALTIRALAMSGRLVYRKEAFIRGVKPEALDDLPRVTAPHERLFAGALAAVALVLSVWTVLAMIPS